jgi:hypothetical protein
MSDGRWTYLRSAQGGVSADGAVCAGREDVHAGSFRPIERKAALGEDLMEQVELRQIRREDGQA